MHNYLRAIGLDSRFSSEHELEQFLNETVMTGSEKKMVPLGNQKFFLEISKSCGPNIGIRICGELNENSFHQLYYYPYLMGEGVTSQADITIEKKVNGEGFAGMSDDSRVGFSLIYFVQNPAELLRQTGGTEPLSGGVTTTISALSQSGMILLPGKPRPRQTVTERKASQERQALINAARDGDAEAIESLTLEDMDTYAMISRRILHEDILTIVDTYMMPYGIECDQYEILGNILFYTRVVNNLTGDALYQMTLEVNDMILDMCINEKDLLGAPEVGRRFKGNVWLQGRIAFGRAA